MIVQRDLTQFLLVKNFNFVQHTKCICQYILSQICECLFFFTSIRVCTEMSACRRWITPPYSRTRITLTPPHQSPWRLSSLRTKMVSCRKHYERIYMSAANTYFK